MKETLDEFRERVLSSNEITDGDLIKWYWEMTQQYVSLQSERDLLLKKVEVLERGCACYRQNQTERNS